MSGVDGRGGRGLPHGVQATKELLRDFRESSVNSRSSTGSTSGVAVENTVISPQETEFYDVDAVTSATRDQKSPERYPSPYNNRQFHHGSMSSLGVSKDLLCRLLYRIAEKIFSNDILIFYNSKFYPCSRVQNRWRAFILKRVEDLEL